jgi:DNA-binding GntR family transcriptional regulator
MTTSSRDPLPGFSPFKSGRKSDTVFDQISEFIRAGRFPAGGKLPAERELSVMFNTSRQTIREAIYRAGLLRGRAEGTRADRPAADGVDQD